MTQLNAKVLNVLYCALDANEFNYISMCNLAKKIWDRLKVIYESTNQVKESKINKLVHNYELFKMGPNESISAMFTKLMEIIMGFNGLGKNN